VPTWELEVAAEGRPLIRCELYEGEGGGAVHVAHAGPCRADGPPYLVRVRVRIRVWVRVRIRVRVRVRVRVPPHTHSQ